MRFRSPSPPPPLLLPSREGSPANAHTDGSSLPTPSITQSEDEGSDQERPRKKARVWAGETEEGYEPIRGLYTFQPTPETFQDFENFIKEIQTVGKRQGVVKIRVPKECIPPPVYAPEEKSTSTSELLQSKTMHQIYQPKLKAARGRSRSQCSSRLSSPEIGSSSRSPSTSSRPRSPSILHADEYSQGHDRPYLLNFHQHMCLHDKCYAINPIYKIETTPSSNIPAADFLTYHAWRDQIAATNPEELYEAEAPTEQSLIDRGLASSCEENEFHKITYSTDNEATPELRSMFSLSDLAMPSLSGNSLFKSENHVAGIHTPYFYFASPASVFAMHMEDYAALSINFHHWGAPKRWVVVCPADSEKLENVVTGMLGLRPSCDQFMRHASIFVPTWVLERAGIRYTKVVQAPGDMVVTFPWAYHEGWNQGFNVAEAIGYGDVKWERWVREYKICGRRCPVKPIEMRFPQEGGFGEESEGEQQGGEEDGERSGSVDGDVEMAVVEEEARSRRGSTSGADIGKDKASNDNSTNAAGKDTIAPTIDEDNENEVAQQKEQRRECNGVGCMKDSGTENDQDEEGSSSSTEDSDNDEDDEYKLSPRVESPEKDPTTSPSPMVVKTEGGSGSGDAGSAVDGDVTMGDDDE
ncbi:JmjC domain, hydroxylase-domain-containing protein [Kalaharituber pfeilii]|nr:JmjC domain, hydroxylase-domain-containing protein [Kalaharituber pfeilii]